MWRFLRLMPLLLLAPDDGAPGGGAQDSDDPDGAGGTEDPKGNQDTTGENDQAIETLQAELDELKKQSSSKDKSVTKLTKQLEELKQALMTDEERKAAEESEHAERIAEERKAFLTDCKAVAAERAGLSEENAQLISGETQEEIRENGKMLKALVEQQFSVRYEKVTKEGMKGKVPQAGDDPAAGIMPL